MFGDPGHVVEDWRYRHDRVRLGDSPNKPARRKLEIRPRLQSFFATRRPPVTPSQRSRNMEKENRLDGHDGYRKQNSSLELLRESQGHVRTTPSKSEGTIMPPMQVSVSAIYKLNEIQFSTLFDKHIDLNALAFLEHSAADGDVQSIDLLLNLALRKDETGKQAVNSLYALFSGRKQGRPTIAEDIQEASLALYDTATKARLKSAAEIGINQFFSSPKLLYMAGSATQDLQQKSEIAELITPKIIAQSSHENDDIGDIWSHSRMICSDELSFLVHHLSQANTALSFNAPFGLVHPESDENMLSDIVAQKLKSETEFPVKPELFPVNTGNHWVMFGIYKDPAENDAIKVVVFDSMPPLGNETKRKLTDTAHLAGLPQEQAICFIEHDLQKNVDNGCGLFAAAAMAHIADNQHRGLTPIQLLQDFASDFASRSPEDHAAFNHAYRRQLLEGLYERSECESRSPA